MAFVYSMKCLSGCVFVCVKHNALHQLYMNLHSHPWGGGSFKYDLHYIPQVYYSKCISINIWKCVLVPSFHTLVISQYLRKCGENSQFWARDPFPKMLNKSLSLRTSTKYTVIKQHFPFFTCCTCTFSCDFEQKDNIVPHVDIF